MRSDMMPRTLRGTGPFLATLCVGLLAASAVAPAAQPAGYSIVARWNPGGAGGWDYLTVDEQGERLFVTRGDRVDVFAIPGGILLGSIAGGGGAHGVALASDLGRGYVSNGQGNSITEFDYSTLAPLRTVPVTGLNPDAVVYDPASRRLLTFNGKSKDVTVLDARSLAPVARIPVPGKPEFARLDGHGKVFANIESEPGQLVRIDVATATLEATWTLQGCNSPTGLAFDKVHARLFSVCDDGVMAVTDAVTGKAVARVHIGDGPDAAEYDAVRGLVFSSNGADGTLSVVRQEGPDRYVPLQSLPTQRSARTMALDAATGRIYLAAADFDLSKAAPGARPPVVPGSFAILVAAPR